jgi:hypothetical protein
LSKGLGFLPSASRLAWVKSGSFSGSYGPAALE